jgi:hypothetical protein
MSQDNLQSFDVSGNDNQYNVPTLQKGQAFLGNVKNLRDSCELPVFLDDSKRAHAIESRIEDPRGKIIRSFQSTSTRSSRTTLSWDYKNDDNSTVNKGFYIWYVTVNGNLHTSTINNIL